MAIVIHEQPAERALVGSAQTQYTFYGDERVVAGGVLSVNRLSLYQMENGDQVTLTWNGQSLTLTARTTPSGPYDIPTGYANVNDKSYLTKLLPYFKKLYLLRRDFTVEINAGSAPGEDWIGWVFTARRPGAQCDFVPLTKPFRYAVLNLTPGRSAGVRPRYSVNATLWVQRPGTDGSNLDSHYDMLYEAPLETGADGFVRFDVAPLLEGLLTTSYPDQPAQADTTSHRRYYVEYAEAYGDPLQVGAVERSVVRTLYRGGTSLARQSEAGYSLDGFVAQPDRFAQALRLGPKTRFVAPDAVQFLSFLNVGVSLASVALQVNVAFEGGAAQERRDLIPAQSWPAGGVLTLAVGPDQLGVLTLLDSKAPGQYAVKLVNAVTGAILSETYTFILDYARRPFARQFAYVNSLGVFDTLTTWGKGSTEYELISQQAGRPLTFPFADAATSEVYGSTYQDKLSVASGWRPLSELRAWRDFYRSPQKYWLRRPLNRLAPDARLPVTLTTKTIREAKDGDNLFAHSFELAVMRVEQYYCPDDELLEEVVVPRDFKAVGTIVLAPAPVVVPTRDPTIPDAVRRFTPALVERLLETVTYGDPNQKGFLKQPTAALLFRSAEEPVAVSDVAGLTDVVYTRTETDNQQLVLQKSLVDQVRFRIRAIPASTPD